MDKPAPPTWLLFLFPLFFVGMWCAALLVLSRIGGWHRLAESFPVRGEPSGRRFGMQSAKVGSVSYNNCLTLYTSTEGLYLSVWLLFRFGHPPLFIPWGDLHNAATRRFLWVESVVFDVGSPRIATLQLSKKVIEEHNVKIQAADNRVNMG